MFTTHQIPPLTSLRAFEAVVRFGSFGAAAKQLRLTPAAISYQIKILETFLRTSLFKRERRQMILTSEGRIYGEAILRAFTEIARASDTLHTGKTSRIVRVAVVPSFAIMADLANGGALKYGKSTFELRLEVRDSDVDFGTEQIDAAIHAGSPLGNGIASRRLFNSRVVPLATPYLWKRYAPITGASDLLRMPLIEFGKAADGWRRWFAQIDSSIEPPSLSLFSDTLSTGIQMAESNLGVILAPLPLASRYLKTKRLETRSSLSVMSRKRDYYLVYREVERSTTKIRAVERWIEGVVSRLKAHDQ